jgi:hypothetical protein
MRVWVYPEKTYEEFGAVRWEVEWQTVGPRALKRIAAAEARGEQDEVDIDRDLVYHYRHYDNEKAAVKAARAIVNLGHATAFGCATVTKEVVDWYVEEDRIAEWAAVGEATYVP